MCKLATHACKEQLEVVEMHFTVIVKDLGSCLEPNRLLKVDAKLVAEKFRKDTPKSSQHSPPVTAEVQDTGIACGLCNKYWHCIQSVRYDPTWHG